MSLVPALAARLRTQHHDGMPDPSPYRVSIDDLEASARVDDEDQVEEHDVTPPADPDAFEKYQHVGSVLHRPNVG